MTSQSTLLSRLKHFLLTGSDKRDSFRRLKDFIKPTDVVLDVGSLDAPYSRHLPNKVVAIDIPPNSIFGYHEHIIEDLKKLRQNFEPMFANAEDMPFPDASFDKIICTELIEHVTRDDLVAKEMARVLKPGGKVYLTTPNGDVFPLEQGIPEHLRHYTKDQLRALLAPHFAEIVQETRFKCHHLICRQYDLLNSWSRNKVHVWKLPLLVCVIGICELLIFIEKYLPGEGYNQVLVCSKPVHKAGDQQA